MVFPMNILSTSYHTFSRSPSLCNVLFVTVSFSLFFFFFFQAEDGIRDLIVTGVQTCALPISPDLRDAYHGFLRLSWPAALSIIVGAYLVLNAIFAGLFLYAGGISGSRADRKSTRLNSSHDQISYAVFCLKKKKQT